MHRVNKEAEERRDKKDGFVVDLKGKGSKRGAPKEETYTKASSQEKLDLPDTANNGSSCLKYKTGQGGGGERGSLVHYYFLFSTGVGGHDS